MKGKYKVQLVIYSILLIFLASIPLILSLGMGRNARAETEHFLFLLFIMINILSLTYAPQTENYKLKIILRITAFVSLTITILTSLFWLWKIIFKGWDGGWIIVTALILLVILSLSLTRQIIKFSSSKH